MNIKNEILSITAGDINLASSRLRSFKLFHDFEGFVVYRDVTVNNFLRSKYIHIQKKANPFVILLALLGRVLNKKVFYDFDDDHFSRSENIYRLFLFILCNKIIVDTQSRLKFISEKWPIIYHKLNYLPDMLDFDISIIKNDISYIDCDKLDFLWYGYPNNIGSIKFIFQHLRGKKNKKIYIISSSKDEVISNLGELYWDENYCHFVKWEPDILGKFDLNNYIIILNHDWERNSNLKSENKLVLALASGFPVIASKTQAYYDFCVKLGIQQILYLYNNDLDFDLFLKNLSFMKIKVDKNKLNKVVIDSFSKEVIQSNFVKLMLG